MNIHHHLRDHWTSAGRRAQVACAALCTTALIAGLAYAAPRDSAADTLTDTAGSTEQAMFGDGANDDVPPATAATTTVAPSMTMAPSTTTVPTAAAQTSVAPTDSTTTVPTRPCGAAERRRRARAGTRCRSGRCRNGRHRAAVAPDAAAESGGRRAPTPRGRGPGNRRVAVGSDVATGRTGRRAREQRLRISTRRRASCTPSSSRRCSHRISGSTSRRTHRPIIDLGDRAAADHRRRRDRRRRMADVLARTAGSPTGRRASSSTTTPTTGSRCIVEDTQGNLEWAIAEYSPGAAPTPDQLATNGDGCYFQCITFGKVELTDSYDRVDLVIVTDLPATEDVLFDVAVSTSEPGWVGDLPLLPTQHTFVVDQDGDNNVRGHVSGLRAVDDVSRRGESHPTRMGIRHMRSGPSPPTPCQYRCRPMCGSPGNGSSCTTTATPVHGWLRRDTTFAWGVDDGVGNPNWVTPYTTYGARNEDKIGDNTSIVLGEGNHHWMSVHEGDIVPRVAVTAHENDTHGNISYEQCIEYRQATYDAVRYDSTCMTRTNVAAMPALTLDDIRALPECSAFDVPADKAQDRCLVLTSRHANDRYAQFDALISFRIVG